MHKLGEATSAEFRKHSKSNGNFLMGITRLSQRYLIHFRVYRNTSNQSPSVKRSLSQISKDSYYARDVSAKNLHASSMLMQKHSPTKSTKVLKVSPTKHEPQYYDFSVSPNCSKHPKLTKLMKDPPNMTTSRDVDEIYIKSVCKKNEYCFFITQVHHFRISPWGEQSWKNNHQQEKGS